MSSGQHLSALKFSDASIILKSQDIWSPGTTKVKKMVVTIIKRVCFIQFSYIDIILALNNDLTSVCTLERFGLENTVIFTYLSIKT